jgi:hypothetical protein
VIEHVLMLLWRQLRARVWALAGAGVEAGVACAQKRKRKTTEGVAGASQASQAADRAQLRETEGLRRCDVL